MVDSLTWSIAVGSFSAITTAIIGGLYSLRTSKLNTEVAIKRLTLDERTASVTEWKAIAEHYQKAGDEREAELLAEIAETRAELAACRAQIKAEADARHAENLAAIAATVKPGFGLELDDNIKQPDIQQIRR